MIHSINKTEDYLEINSKQAYYNIQEIKEQPQVIYRVEIHKKTERFLQEYLTLWEGIDMIKKKDETNKC